MPLLEFLAYYQVLEYYFPYFSSEEVIRSMRNFIVDPRFDARDDVAISRLVSLARPGARTSGSEREQIRLTVAACIDSTELRAWLTADEPMKAHFCANKPAIKSVKRINSAMIRTCATRWRIGSMIFVAA